MPLREDPEADAALAAAAKALSHPVRVRILRMLAQREARILSFSRFSANLDWLKSQGVSVERFNLAQQPAAFADDDQVRGVLQAKGPAGLPVVMVNGEVKSSGVYPTRVDLAGWAGVEAKVSLNKPIMLTARQ
jgi:hypothetical protein